MIEIHRGDIYHVMPLDTGTGSEQRADRPAVIVSNELNNRYSPNVEIVFLTSQKKKSLPTHVPVMCYVPSTALCENILTISKERLGTFIKSCTKTEFENIDNALLVSLGIDIISSADKEESQRVSSSERTSAEVKRDLYKRLYEQILDKLMGGNVND